LMLDNWKGFNSAVIMAGGGKDPISEQYNLPLSLSTCAGEGLEEELVSKKPMPHSVQVAA